jgi:hypothetical protein
VLIVSPKYEAMVFCALSPSTALYVCQGIGFISTKIRIIPFHVGLPVGADSALDSRGHITSNAFENETLHVLKS